MWEEAWTSSHIFFSPNFWQALLAAGFILVVLPHDEREQLR
ncbi:MAG: hypothetical protein JWP81_3947 [Ferruginibacter sp.]|nr:hypothetical protein [Ferruginibacter sp.]